MVVVKARQTKVSLQIPLGILLVLAILYVAKVVLIPLVAAVLLTFMLAPIVTILQRIGVPRALSVVITVLLAFALFGVSGYIIGSQIHSLAGELPKHRDQIEAKFASLRDEGGTISQFRQMVREITKSDSELKSLPGPGKDRVVDVVVTRPEEPSSVEKILQAVGPVIEPLANAGFVIVLVIFMLFHREDLRNRFIGLLGDGRLTGTTRLIVDSAQRLSDYLLAQALINLVFGILFALGLYLIGVEYAMLWGFVTALMRFVPYIGSWISVLLPFALSFATAPTWAQPISLLVYFGVLDLVTANAVEPLILGHRTGVSPIALLVAAAFWTWLWGPMGLVLSTPLTVCLVVIGQNVPSLRSLAILLGDQPALEPPIRFYQRLLARDETEAKEVAVEYVKAEGLEKVYDDVLLSALAMARLDRRDAGLEAEDEEFILQATRDILRVIEANPSLGKDAALAQGEQPSAAPEDGAKPLEASAPVVQRVLILGCPAHHQAEELSLQMLAALLKPNGCDIEVVSTKALPAEIEARMEQSMPSLVFIAVLPPGGLVQARYLCKRLRKRFPDLSIVVGYWGKAHDFDKLFRQVRSAGGNYLATSLLQARSQIDTLIHPAVPEKAALQEV
jgi:predicted PurR-regulated permease PerM